jgi:hypothetical protein
LLLATKQAQTYFAGQSRYVGVYDSSRLAARAYVVVQEQLRQYRTNRSFAKETPKEELALLFAAARRAADDAVRQLKNEIRMGNDEAVSNPQDTTREITDVSSETAETLPRTIATPIVLQAPFIESQREADRVTHIDNNCPIVASVAAAKSNSVEK